MGIKDELFCCQICGSLLKASEKDERGFKCGMCGAEIYHICPCCEYPSLSCMLDGEICADCLSILEKTEILEMAVQKIFIN